MKAKKLSISIFLIIFIIFGAISAVVYNKSETVDIMCYSGSYAEEYAKEHNLNYEIISDSDTYIGVLNLEKFAYNNDGTIVSYKGKSAKIAIPAEINGVKITKVAKKAFSKAVNLKRIFLPKQITSFEAKDLENVIVYMYKDTDLYENLSADETVKFKIKTISDSYFVNYYSANIPFSYNRISNKSIEINKYNGTEKKVIIPESINGRIVTTISFDALEKDIETLIIPKNITSIDGVLYSNRYDMTFLIGLLIAFVGTIIAIVFVLTLKVDTKEKMFLTIPQFRTAYIVFVLTLILSVILLFIDVVPDFVVYILIALIYGWASISMLKTNVAISAVEEIDKKVKVQTTFIKALTIDAEHLMNTSKTTEIKTLTKKVYEAVRYSDPMSNAALVETEEKIQKIFWEFGNAVNGEDFENASSIADELLSLINIRNKKCRLLK